MGLQSPKSGPQSQGSRQVATEEEPVLAERICRFLERRHAGKAKVAEAVEAETRIPADTVRKMLLRRSMPSAMNYIRYWSAYGPDFLAAVHPGAGCLDERARLQRRARLDAAIAALLSERAAL